MSIEFKLNSAGVRKILRSVEMQAELKRRATAIANSAQLQPGEKPLVVEATEGKNRARATVFRPGGLTKEADDRALGNALDAGRG